MFHIPERHQGRRLSVGDVSLAEHQARTFQEDHFFLVLRSPGLSAARPTLSEESNCTSYSAFQHQTVNVRSSCSGVMGLRLCDSCLSHLCASFSSSGSLPASHRSIRLDRRGRMTLAFRTILSRWRMRAVKTNSRSDG